MHKHNCYVTLTYNDDNLPPHHALRYRDYQRFMRKLRKALGRKRTRKNRFVVQTQNENANTCPWKVRFYMAGEYGELHGRPHFHAILFGIDFNDRRFYKRSPSGEKIYTSATLEKLWPHGFSSVGNVTYASAAYVARYIMKKRTGDGNKNDYEILDLDSGEIIKRKKEFNNMSRRPGIAHTWFQKYQGDIYNVTGKLIVKGHPRNPPRYYDKLFKKIDSEALEGYKHARYLEQLAQAEHHTPERLAVQEQVQTARTTSLKRNKT